MSNDGTLLNPGFGKPSRFAFFGAPRVPALYASDAAEGAVHETILHDAEPGSFIPGAHWRTKVLTVLEVTRELELAAFHSAGLRRFGMYAKDLTDTSSIHYSATVQWAQAAHKASFHGVSYMCRHYNSAKAVCLFEIGARRHPALRAVPGHPESRVFALPRDSDWLAGIALAMQVVLRP